MKQEYDYFDSTYISGKLEKIGIRYHMTSFTLQNGNREYFFEPHNDNQGHYFPAFAKRDDSIIKMPHSNSLIIKKANISYTFYFQKLSKPLKPNFFKSPHHFPFSIFISPFPVTFATHKLVYTS